MDNPLKDDLDRASIIKDITERENIIYRYKTTGFLDRDDAIKKIISIQIEDFELRLATIENQLVNGRVDFQQLNNNLIIVNIQFQIDFLKSKLSKKALEEKK